MKYALALGAAAAFAMTAAVAGDKGKDWEAKVETHFKEVDVNADNQVTEQELVDYMTAKARTEFAAMAGGDASVTLAEAKAHHKTKHEAMMKDHAAMDGDDKMGDQ